jgi:CYTH domain-containing protein
MNDPRIETYLLDELRKYKTNVYHIQQAYIGAEGRIRRRIKTHHRGEKLKTADVQHFFTYKKKLKKQKGSLELEMEIDANDFNLAWNDVDFGTTAEQFVSLEKTRYCLHMPWQEMWEVDFFKYEGKTYFVLAECELQSHTDAPKGMPDIVADNLIYIVPDNDTRFKNRRLADPLQTSNLLQEILAETVHGKAVQQDETVPLQSILSCQYTRNAE